MGRISNIPQDEELSGVDELIGSDASGATRSYPLEAIATFTEANFMLGSMAEEDRDELLTADLSGRMIFNTTTNTFEGYNGTAWVRLDNA